MKLPEEIIFSNGVPYGKVGNASQVREIMNTDRLTFESEIVNRYNNYDKMKEALQDTYSLLVAFDYGTNSPPARTQFLNNIKQLLDSLK